MIEKNGKESRGYKDLQSDLEINTRNIEYHYQDVQFNDGSILVVEAIDILKSLQDDLRDAIDPDQGLMRLVVWEYTLGQRLAETAGVYGRQVFFDHEKIKYYKELAHDTNVPFNEIMGNTLLWLYARAVINAIDARGDEDSVCHLMLCENLRQIKMTELMLEGKNYIQAFTRCYSQDADEIFELTENDTFSTLIKEMRQAKANERKLSVSSHSKAPHLRMIKTMGPS